MDRPIERVSLTVYDMERDGLTAPDAQGGLVYSPLWIPPHLRTEVYDRLLCNNPAVASRRDPDALLAGHRARWAMIEAVRTRIAKGELAVRTLLGQSALRQTLGQRTTRLGLQVDVLEEVMGQVRDDRQEIGIMTYDTDMRPAINGEFRVVHYAGRPSVVAAPIRGASDLVTCSQGIEPDRSFQNAEASFEALWQDPATLTDPEEVIGHLAAVVGEIRSRAVE